MGLGVMGHMLALNMERHGFRVAMFDVTPGKVKGIAAEHPGFNLENLLLDDSFRTVVESHQDAWRFTVQSAIGMGIPVLALSASLAYFDGYRSEPLPANLTQAQRDLFGAHTYRRTDREGSFHTEWSTTPDEAHS